MKYAQGFNKRWAGALTSPGRRNPNRFPDGARVVSTEGVPARWRAREGATPTASPTEPAWSLGTASPPESANRQIFGRLPKLRPETNTVHTRAG